MKYPLVHERKQNLCAAQWYIYFSLIRIQTSFTAQSLGYKAFFQQSDYLSKCYERGCSF